MGVGHPQDVATYARLGVDLFDCVLPTRLGRNGAVWTDLEGSRIDLNRRAILAEPGPIRAGCSCTACREWSLGSLGALVQTHDQLGFRLASAHNLHVLADVLAGVRQQVLYTA
jgi:queuine tRNA-ribosyltransferase